MLPYGVGVGPCPLMICGVIRHEQSGLLVDPKKGVVYGAAGTPVGAVCGDGYVRLGGRGKSSLHLYAHRVIWQAANGDIPDGLEIDHLNGNKADNRARNLEAVTKSQNVRRAIALGLAPVGEQKAQAKLTDDKVREIRATVETITAAQWARDLGVDKSTIKAVRERKTWRHVACRGRSKPAAKTGHAGKRPRRRS